MNRKLQVSAVLVAAFGVGVGLAGACHSTPQPCRTPADCGGGCCILEDAKAATGLCGDPGAGQPCLCLANADCPGNDTCCQPFLDDGGIPTASQVCSAEVDGGSPGIYQCCRGGLTTCQGALCCANMSTGGEYCAPACDTDADCNGGTCVAGAPVDLFGCGSGKYCGPVRIGPSSSSSSSSSGTMAPGVCHVPADCGGGCCALEDAGAAAGKCVVDVDAGAACLCLANADCPGNDGCCQPLLDDGGVPTGAQVCATATGSPGDYQCCSGQSNCQGNLCCVNMNSGGEYCTMPCSADADCDGGHCTAGSAATLFGCGSGDYCGP